MRMRKILIRQEVEISPGEEKEIFDYQLRQLAGPFWVEKGKVWRLSHFHEIPTEVADENDPKFHVVVAACKLQDALKSAEMVQRLTGE